MQFFCRRAQPQQNSAETYLKRGAESLQRGDYLQALLDYGDALGTATPQHRSKAYAGRSAAYLALGNLHKASEEESRRIELGADDVAEAYSQRGRIRVELQQLADAQEDAEQAIKLNDKDASAYFVRGMCLFQSGDFAQAARDLDQFVGAAANDDRFSGGDVKIALSLIEECRTNSARQPRSSELSGGIQVGNITINPDLKVYDHQGKETPRLYKAGEYIQDRYLVIKVMKGGMGIVYVADDVYQGKVHTIKSYQPQFFQDERSKIRFENEAHTWVALGRHPNIVRASWFSRIAGNPYIFLEYVDGSNLSELIVEKGRFSVKLTLSLMLQVCNGMVYVGDRHQIVHRDLKPANVLLTQHGMVKITDFGLARALDTEQAVDATAKMAGGVVAAALTQGGLGTLPYMAPEQFDNAHDIDVTADIYAAGIMLYEMLTGDIPFLGRTIEEFKRLHKEAPVPSLPDLDNQPGLSRLNIIIGRCLKKNPVDRYLTFTALYRELSILAEATLGVGYAAEMPEELSVDDLNDKGAYLSNLGEYEQALACFNEAIRLDPTFHVAYANKAVLFGKLQQFEDAVVCYRKTLELRPSFHYPRTNYSQVLSALGRHEEALAEAEILINVWSESPIGWRDKAYSLRELRRFQESLDCYNKALALKNGPMPEEIHRTEWLANVYYSCGNCLRMLGDNERGVQSYRESLALMEANPGCWLNLGNALFDLKREAEAIEAYDRAIALYPAYEKAYVNKASACEQLKRIDIAIECLESALQINPNSIHTLALQGNLLFEHGDYERALSVFTHITELNSDEPVGWRGRAFCFEKLGNETAALESRWMEGLRERPTNPESHEPAQVIVVRPDSSAEARAFLRTIVGTPTCHFCQCELPDQPVLETIVIRNRAEQEKMSKGSFLLPRVCLKCKLVICHQCAYNAAKKIGAREFVCPSCYGRISS